MRLLGTIARVAIIELVDQQVAWIAGARIDCDGRGGNPDNDRYFQPDTTLHFEGKPLHAYEESFIVVPPLILQRTREIVLGCQAYVTNLQTGIVRPAVVGDSGPPDKIGEMSCACASSIGLDGNPNHGGTDELIIGYEILPGVPAIVNNRIYNLQPWKR